MTDFFALLDQSRSPWLDPEELKQAFHEKTLREHPDAQQPGENHGAAEGAFSQLNEAYQALRDPKRRLHHLLALEGRAPSTAPAAIPKEIADLFSEVAGLTQKSDRIIQRRAQATTALGRSLMSAEVAELQTSLGATLGRLSEIYTVAVEESKKACASWTSEQLQALYVQFSYVIRWIAQLEEKQLQLTV